MEHQAYSGRWYLSPNIYVNPKVLTNKLPKKGLCFSFPCRILSLGPMLKTCFRKYKHFCVVTFSLESDCNVGYVKSFLNIQSANFNPIINTIKVWFIFSPVIFFKSDFSPV